MKKSVFNFAQKALSCWILGLIVALTGCDNFLEGIDLKESIDSKVQYMSAESNTVLIQAAENTGTPVPSGNVPVKIGYEFEVKFTENSEYCFLNWVAENEKNEILGSEVVSFSDSKALFTKVTVAKNISGIKIVPNCVKRISLANEPSPKWESKGVSRDRSITVQFTKKPALASFVFSEDEIPANATAKKDVNENIYAYILNERTYFKNISITNEADISLAEHFKAPEIKDNLLLVEVEKSKPIEIEVGETFKTIKVTLGADIQDESGVRMNVDKVWNYRITEATDEKANIIFPQGQGTNAEEGRVGAISKEYSIGQTIALSFTENAGYQFVKWSYDDSIVAIADEKNISTTVVVKEKSDATEITAVCEPRLRVTEFSPVNNAENPTVSKNSSIIISFNKNIPSDDADLAQLKNINISIGGALIKNTFEEPLIDGNTITFKASTENLLDIPEGQTKIITVSVPADFYYKLEDGTKIFYGENGAAFDYKVDYTTLSKAEINFAATENSGTITPSGTGNKYSIGQEIQLKFELEPGYIFNGWTVTSGGTEVAESKIKIADKTSPNTKLYIYDAVPAVIVKANCSEKLSLVNKPDPNNVKPKDSDIVITFNKALDSSCESLLNKIKVSINGSNVDSNFEQRSLDGKTITLKNTRLLDVTGSDVKTVTVTVPAVFFYVNGDNNVKMEEEDSFDYKVDATTTARAKIDFEVVDGKTGTEITGGNAGTLNVSNHEEFYIGQSQSLVLDVKKEFQFYGWEIVDASGSIVPSTTLKLNSSEASTELILNEACSDIKIKAVVYRRPSVVEYGPKSANANEEFAKDNPINIKFGCPIADGVENNIQVSYSNGNIVKDIYYNTSVSSDSVSSTVTLSSIKYLSLNNLYEIITVTVPHDKIYYFANDNKTKIFMGDEDFEWSFRINNKTTEKVDLRFIIDDKSESTVTGYKVNNTLLSTGSKETFNIEQEISLQYPLTDGYGFEGWKLESATSGYTVEPAGYVKSGKIHVKSGTSDYLVLSVNEEDFTKASIKVLGGIGNGLELYGVTVSAKDNLLPLITDIKPDYFSTGVECDSPIKITFNKAIDIWSVDFGIGAAIQIVNPANENEHFEEYFNPPVWNSDSTELTIKPKYSILDLFSNKSSTVNLQIKIDTESICDAADRTLVNKNSTKIYRINNSIETDAPVITKLNLYLPDFYDANSNNNVTELRSISMGNTEDEIKNSLVYARIHHAQDYVYIDCEALDEGTGVATIKISEKVIESNGSGTGRTRENTFSFTNKGNGVYSLNPSKNSAYYKYNIQSPQDGLIELEISVIDQGGSESAKQYFYVIKDTVLDETQIKPDAETRSFTETGPYNQITNDVITKENFIRRINSNGTDTVTLNFSQNAKDAFFGTRTDVVSIKAYYSYDINNINTEIPNSSNDNTIRTFSFNRNPSKNTFIKYCISDKVGNEKEVIRAIPRNANITNLIDTTKTTSNKYIDPDDPNGKKYSLIYGAKQFEISNNKEIESAVNQINADKHDYFYIYTFTPTLEESENPQFYMNNYSSENGSENPFAYDIKISGGDENHPSGEIIGSRTEGVYRIYIVPYFSFAERRYYGTISEPFIYLHKITSSVATESLTFYLPNSPVTCSVAPAEKSTGKRDLTISMELTDEQITKAKEKQLSYFYNVIYPTTTTPKDNYFEANIEGSTNISVPSGNNVEISVMVRDSFGNQEILENSKKLPLDLTEDNIPPYLNSLNYTSTQLGQVITNLTSRRSGYLTLSYSVETGDNDIRSANYTGTPTDNGTAGLYKNRNGEYEFNYYFLKNPLNKNLAIPYTKKDIETLTPYVFTYTEAVKETNILNLPIDSASLEPGYYTLVVDLKDALGNEKIETLICYAPECIYDKNVSVDIDDNDKINFTINNNSNINYQLSLDYINLNDKGRMINWGLRKRFFHTDFDIGTEKTQLKLGSRLNCSTNSSGTEYSDKTYSRKAFTGKTFYRISLSETPNGPYTAFYKKVYFCPDYIKDKSLIKNKNVLTGGFGGYQIFCDAPCYIHTLYSAKNLQNDKDAWASFAFEVQSAYTEENMTYSEDTGKIPTGAYYTTVVHFADGTSLMTGVKQKN
ncbi:MAG: hypothetical protein KBT11_00715 [Treponema sp.]|nr:hypothetical protein [Candidatus Treponema equifaecale]